MRTSKNTIGEIALLFLVFIVMIRSLVPTVFTSWNNVYICFCILIVLLILRNLYYYKTVIFQVQLFTLFIFLTFVAMLYKNNAFQNKEYNFIITIFFTSLLLLFFQNDKISIFGFKKIAILICSLAIVFAIFTWMCYFSPSFYYDRIIPLFPNSLRETLVVNYKYYNMIAGLTDHYSRNAFYIMLGFMILMLNFKKYKHKWLILMTIIFLGMTLGLIGKRGHIIFCFVSLVLTLFIKSKITLKSFLYNNFKIITFLILAFFVFLMTPGTSSFLKRMFLSDTQDFTSGRTTLYSLALDLADKTYYLGSGWGSFTASVDYQYAGVHNDYLQLLSEIGFIGLFLFVLFHCFCLYKSVKFYKQYEYESNIASVIIFSIAFQIFFMLYSLTGIPHYDSEVYVIYLLSAGIPWIISLKRNDEEGKGV